MNDNLGWGAVAGDQGRTRAARRPALGGLGGRQRPWSGRCGRGPRANCCGLAARSGGDMNAWMVGQAQLKCLGQRRDGPDPRRTSSPLGGG